MLYTGDFITHGFVRIHTDTKKELTSLSINYTDKSDFENAIS